jgi:hypothetical protein
MQEELHIYCLGHVAQALVPAASRLIGTPAGVLQKASRRVGTRVAVGTLITERPPHRSVLALLTHTVPTLDVDVTQTRRACSVRSLGSVVHLLILALCPVQAPAVGSPWSAAFPPRPPPPGCPGLVRAFRRYYAAARPPAAVHGGLMAHRLLPPARLLLAGGCGVSRFSRMESLCMLGVFDSAGPCHTRARV